MLKSLGLIQIFVLLVVATLFVMTWDFGRRILENVQLVQAAQAADAQLARVQEQHDQLTKLKQDVSTDPWVERNARTNLHYTREGETLFIPIHRTAPPPAPEPVTTSAPPARPIWQDWLEAIFGPSQ